jgi:N-methylhydantoinase A
LTRALAIDIGGTFTDLVLHDPATGCFAAHKELTTPEAPERGVLSGIRHLLRARGPRPRRWAAWCTPPRS